MTHKKIKNILINGKMAVKNKNALSDSVRQIMDSALNALSNGRPGDAYDILKLLVAEVLKSVKDPVLTGWDAYIPVIKREFDNKKYDKVFRIVRKDVLLKTLEECNGVDIIDSIKKERNDLQDIVNHYGAPYNL